MRCDLESKAVRWQPQQTQADAYDQLMIVTRQAMADLFIKPPVEVTDETQEADVQEEVGIQVDRRANPKAVRRKTSNGKSKTR